MTTIEAKVVVVGSEGVGKTSMIVCYMAKSYQRHINPTIGASFFTCKLSVESRRITLQVWDTAGQERFRSMAPMYYRGANAAMLVFDMTQYKTFTAIKSWVDELRRNVEGTVILAVIGNKSDLTDKRQVSDEEARAYATNIGATYHEISVLENQGIDDVFLVIGRAMLRLSPNTPKQTSPIRIHNSASANSTKTNQSAATTDTGQLSESESGILAHPKSNACC